LEHVEFRAKMFKHLGNNSYINVNIRKLYIVKTSLNIFISKTGE
jgi:hypothetical protein